MIVKVLGVLFVAVLAGGAYMWYSILSTFNLKG